MVEGEVVWQGCVLCGDIGQSEDFCVSGAKSASSARRRLGGLVSLGRGGSGSDMYTTVWDVLERARGF